MSAIISRCGKYRYRLDRDCGQPFDGSKTFAFFGINPSTADATLDDSTIRRLRGFTISYGGHRFIVGNVFAYRATDVGELSRCSDPVGPDQSTYLQQIINDADVLVPCWGNSGKVPGPLRYFIASTLELIHAAEKPVMHFGLTASGDPKHPLRLCKDTPLTAMRFIDAVRGIN